MTVIEMTQFLRPQGRQRKVTMPAPKDMEDDYKQMLEDGFHLEGEMLSTGEVSITVSDDDADYDISVIPNGPEVIKAIGRMLQRKKWQDPNSILEDF